MKKILFTLIIASIIVVACNSPKKNSAQKATASVEQNQSFASDTIPVYNGQKHTASLSDYDYTAPYICPNHCPGSGSDKPGKCPQCGSELIPNPMYKSQQDTN